MENLTYKKILEIRGNLRKRENDETTEMYIKLLSPVPVISPEYLEEEIITRFRYTGPGKWYKIIREGLSTEIKGKD